jgi:ParB-like chromosome segregation protein Spo0J
MKNKIEKIKKELMSISKLSNGEKIEVINEIKLFLHKISPFKKEPVDCVLWIKNSELKANDYNPNSVAPPEMELLHLSIKEDGYTQPIVSYKTEKEIEVVDGFHRYRIGKDYKDINDRIMGYLPITIINDERGEKGDRIAATIRHNRARGKHQIGAMSDIVLELKRRNWSDAKIGKQLGMDQDEVLRLTQISGITEMFKDKDFSQAWESGEVKEDDMQIDFENLD